MRGTLHFVPARDARWMVRLLAPRVIARSAARYRALELDEAALRQSRRILIRDLEGGRRLTRPQAYAALDRGGVSPAGQRGIHILSRLAQEGLLCFGLHEGRQPTFVLLDEWLPDSRNPTPEEALGTLARRYFASHGPATLQDFAWWSGLTVKESREAFESARGSLRLEAADGREWLSAVDERPATVDRPLAALLPPWDEYLVAYRNRDDVIAPSAMPPSPYWIGSPLVLLDGRVRGSWGRAVSGASVVIEANLWGPATRAEREALATAAARYGRFTGLSVEMRGSPPAARRARHSRARGAA
jgi:hypothetical protein